MGELLRVKSGGKGEFCSKSGGVFGKNVCKIDRSRIRRLEGYMGGDYLGGSYGIDPIGKPFVGLPTGLLGLLFVGGTQHFG